MNAEAHTLDSTSAAPLPAPPPGWMTAAEAAGILGLGRDAVCRRAASGALPGRLCQAAGQGPAWWIDAANVPALRIARGDVAAPVPAEGDLAGLSESQRLRLYDTYNLVARYLADRDARPPGMPVNLFTRRWCAAISAIEHRSITRTTLLRWAERYRRGGLAALADRRGGGAAEKPYSPEAMEFLVAMYCDQARPSVAVAWERTAAVAASRGWAMPARRTARHYVQLEVDPKLLAAGRDPKRYRDRCIPDVLRDWSQVPAMGCWVADHRRLDVLIPHAVEIADPTRPGLRTVRWAWHRPWLTLYIDARTWKPMARAIRFEDPNAQIVMSTLAAGIERHGLPERLYLDNGKDFSSRAFSGARRRRTARTDLLPESQRSMLEALGVLITSALPYNAKAKVIEPWFRLMSERFDRTFESYCGNRADRKPERLKALNGRAEEYHAKGLTLDSVIAAFDRWVEDDYCLRECPVEASKPHTVNEAFAGLRREGYVERRPAMADLALLCMPSVPVVVSKNGIWVAAHGQWFWSDELEDRRCASGRDRGRKIIYRYRDDDPSTIWVFDATSGRFLCTAGPRPGQAVHPLAATEADREALRRGIQFARAHARGPRQALRELRVHGHELLLAAQRRGAEASGLISPDRTPPPTPRGTTVAFLGEISRAAQADDRRGAEADGPPQPRPPSSVLCASAVNPSAALATGTDDIRPAAGPRGNGPSALDHLAAAYAAEEEAEHDRDGTGRAT